MSLSTPTTKELSDTFVSYLSLALGQTIPLLPKSFTRVLAKAVAGIFVLIYKYAGFIFLQMFVRHASFKETEVNGEKIIPLVEWGRLIGVGDPEPATRAELDIDVVIETATVGGLIEAGAHVLFPDTGVIYQTLTAIPTDVETTETVTIQAVSDQEGNQGLGSVGNLQIGDIVTFANPLPNIRRDAEVSAVVTTAADGEAEASYRARVLKRFKRRPQGGAPADYQQWGEEDPGILNVYPYRGVPGVVDIYVEATEASSGSADGIPTSAQLDAVEAAIEQTEGGKAARRPVNALVAVRPITRTAFDVEITGLSAADETQAKADIEQALDQYFRSREPFIVGLSVLPRKSRVTEAAIGGVVDDVVSASGDSFTTLSLSEGGVTITAKALGKGEKAKLGTVTYV